MALAVKCRKSIELVDKYRVNQKVHKKSKIGQTNEKLVLKSIDFFRKRYKIGAACWQRLGKCALSLPGRKFNRGCTFLAQNSICDRFTKFLSKLFYLFSCISHTLLCHSVSEFILLHSVFLSSLLLHLFDLFHVFLFTRCLG